jgi:DNA-directed RNA polymerase specialized sigma24 family protein
MAEDITQEAFLALATMADRFDGRDSARPLLLGIAAKLVHDHRRRSGRWAEVLRSVSHIDRLLERPEDAFVGDAEEPLGVARRAAIVAAHEANARMAPSNGSSATT